MLIFNLAEGFDFNQFLGACWSFLENVAADEQAIETEGDFK